METTIKQSPSSEQVLNQNYITLLERTNQQLSLWSNPYGIMIGILALLFALAAIIVSVYLWWNSREQRRERKEQADNFFSSLKEIANKNIEEARKQYDELIAAQEKTLKSSTKNKDELQRALTELKKERANIGTNIGNSLGATAAWGTTVPLNNINASGMYTGGINPSTVWATSGPTSIGVPLFTATGYNGDINASGMPTFSGMPFCPKCNTFCGYGKKYCSGCGTKI